jgi:hypothetical protein
MMNFFNLFTRDAHPKTSRQPGESYQSGSLTAKSWM